MVDVEENNDRWWFQKKRWLSLNSDGQLSFLLSSFSWVRDPLCSLLPHRFPPLQRSGLPLSLPPSSHLNDYHNNYYYLCITCNKVINFYYCISLENRCANYVAKFDWLEHVQYTYSYFYISILWNQKGTVDAKIELVVLCIMPSFKMTSNKFKYSYFSSN